MSTPSSHQALRNQVTQLSQKVQLLAEAYRHLRTELGIADKERHDLQQQLDTQREKVRDFQKQIKFNTIASTLASPDADADMLRSRLDDYIKEIDACIAYLQQ
jgi:chromosome segregation ATPase